MPSRTSASHTWRCSSSGTSIMHDVAAAGGVGDRQHLEPGVARPARRESELVAQAYDDVDAGVLEVQGVGVALRAVADDRDGLAVEEGEICVVVVVHGAPDPIYPGLRRVPSRAPGMEAPEVQGSFMPFRFAGFALAAMLMLSACGGGGSKNTTASGPQRLDVTARDYALNVSGSTALRPGPVQITAHNAGKQAHGIVLAKLKRRRTATNVIKTFVKDPSAGGAMLLYAGGTTTLPRGSTWKGDHELRRRHYPWSTSASAAGA